MPGHRPKGLRHNQIENIIVESGFVCAHCGRAVTPDPAGSAHRNHCPWCLHSLHLDIRPGDRASRCGGLMEPVAISVRQDKEWVIIHRCEKCGVLKENRTAGDDNAAALLSLAVRPVARPPFPLDGIMEK
jgi:ribosome biogenesis GTPase / thiamine phosphate phosphatase